MSRYASAFCLGLLLAATARAQQPDAAPNQPREPVAVATVNGEPLYLAEVDEETRRVTAIRGTNPEGAEKLRAEVLKQMVNQRLVAQMLAKNPQYVDPKEIDKEIEKLDYAVSAKRLTLEQATKMQGISVDTLRARMVFQKGWDKYLQAHLADSLQDYFKRHSRELDGTQVHASHILLRHERTSDTPQSVLKRAERVREEIASGKLTFADAARKYSVAPSASQGGDIGFFPCYGVMDPRFATAAFKLEKGEVSKPVMTGHGAHLITVHDEKPGNRQWTELVKQMQIPASIELFNELAGKLRADARIEYTGKSPYFKDGTDEVVVPTQKS